VRLAVAGSGGLAKRLRSRLGTEHDLCTVEGPAIQPDAYGPGLVGVEVLVLVLDQGGAEGDLLERDLKGSQALLHAFTAWGTPRLLVVVSSALLADQEPIDPDVPLSRYGSPWLATRAAVEARVLHLSRRLDLETVVVRAGHVHGADDVAGGVLEPLLRAVRHAAETGQELALAGLEIGLPFVHADVLVDALTARINGTALPGEQVLTDRFARVDAVGAVWTLAELHDARAQLAGKPAWRKELAVRGPGLTSRLIGSLVPSKAPELVPEYVKRAPVRRAPRAWRKAYGERDLATDAPGI
jgi:nucleoside-diphosphate-sugar epimerase